MSFKSRSGFTVLKLDIFRCSALLFTYAMHVFAFLSFPTSVTHVFDLIVLYCHIFRYFMT